MGDAYGLNAAAIDLDDARVKDRWAPPDEPGASRPTAVTVGAIRARHQRRWVIHPVSEIRRADVAPMWSRPNGGVWVVLVEEVIATVALYRAVRIVEPVLGCR